MKRKRVTAYAAKTHLGQLLRDAEAGSSFLIVRRGKPVARLDPPGEDDSRGLKSIAAAFRDLRERIRAHNKGKPPLKAKDLINEGRKY